MKKITGIIIANTDGSMIYREEVPKLQEGSDVIGPMPAIGLLQAKLIKPID